MFSGLKIILRVLLVLAAIGLCLPTHDVEQPLSGIVSPGEASKFLGTIAPINGVQKQVLSHLKGSNG